MTQSFTGPLCMAVSEDAQCDLRNRKGDSLWRTTSDSSPKRTRAFTGKIETLALKVPAEFTRLTDRTHENAPLYEIFSDELRIGAAWERQGKKANTSP
jgi:Protein of unknown function (DUF736)